MGWHVSCLVGEMSEHPRRRPEPNPPSLPQAATVPSKTQHGLRFASLAALLAECETRLRVMHRSSRTIEAYLGWIRPFVAESDRNSPELMGKSEVEALLSKLAVRHGVSASTQNQALSALLFLYNQMLGAPLEHMQALVRARQPMNLPVVLSRSEAGRILENMNGVTRLMTALLYGSGLRLSEYCALRVKDVDFERRQLCVRRGKGRKDRMTLLPGNLMGPLQEHLQGVGLQHGVAFREHQQASQLSYLSPFVCNGAFDGRLRHSHHSEVAWPQRRPHHDDLHARG